MSNLKLPFYNSKGDWIETTLPQIISRLRDQISELVIDLSAADLVPIKEELDLLIKAAIDLRHLTYTALLEARAEEMREARLSAQAVEEESRISKEIEKSNEAQGLDSF